MSRRELADCLEAAFEAASAKRQRRGEKKNNPMVLVINLKRRQDRLRAVRQVLKGVQWERVEAVDGRTLSWPEVEEYLSKKALADAKWAEKHGVPTICRRTGSFSPHLTLAGVGCALSHRRAWEQLAASDKHDWALILEDDVSAVAGDLGAALERAIASLPSQWQFCYAGYHESSGQLLAPDQRLRVFELGLEEGQTGLFGYLLRRSAAADMLQARDIWPLAHQIDVQVGMRHWGPSSRFALNPEAVLIHSPKSEDGACDTDVQVLGDECKKAHAKMLPSMLLL